MASQNKVPNTVNPLLSWQYSDLKKMTPWWLAWREMAFNVLGVDLELQRCEMEKILLAVLLQRCALEKRFLGARYSSVPNNKPGS